MNLPTVYLLFGFKQQFLKCRWAVLLVTQQVPSFWKPESTLHPPSTPHVPCPPPALCCPGVRERERWPPGAKSRGHDEELYSNPPVTGKPRSQKDAFHLKALGAGMQKAHCTGQNGCRLGDKSVLT